METYSTLRIYSDAVSPESITDRLGIQPTWSFKMGEAFGKGELRRKTNGWFYSTEGATDSKDNRRHVDLILSALDGKAVALHALQNAQCEIDICSYWMSVGQGGPTLWPHQMAKLGELGIGVWWDIYFAKNENDE